MKVLHICSFYRPFGGAEKLLFSALDLLEARGVENVVLAPKSQAAGATGKRTEHFVDFLEYPFEQHGIYAAVRDNTKLMASITDVIHTEQPDVIHLHNQQNPFIYKASVDSGIPLVRNVHDPRLYCPTNWRLLPDESLCPHPFGRACITEGCVKPTAPEMKHIAVMAWNRKLSFENTTLIIESRESYALAKQNGYRDEQLCLIPNCTHVPDRNIVEAEKAAACRDEGDEILFVGRASREKGIPFLLKALTKVQRPCTLNLLTAGDYFHHEIAPLITRLGLESRVNVKLNTSYADTARYYASADAVIVPSVWFETFCLVGIEAYSHMTPVIGTRVGGIKDWCVHEETGLLVDIFDEAALAASIDRMLGDRQLRHRLGLNGYKRTQRLYSEQAYFERLYGLYEKVKTDGARDTDRLSRLAGWAVQPGPRVPDVVSEDGRA